MKTLTLPLKREYFEAIKNGSKTEEYRLSTDYWFKRLVRRNYDQIVLTLGYPKKDDHSRRLVRPWCGYSVRVITHEHFGDKPVTVFVIPVN
jgi:hypothetical protein